MKITHRQTPPDAERPRRKKQSGAALIAVLAVALVAGIGLVAVLDSMTAPEPTEPERTAPVNITTTQPSTTETTTVTTTAKTTAKTAPSTQAEQPLYVLPLSNNVIAEYSDTPVWNDTLQSYRVHQAVDFGGHVGDKIVALTNGTVTAVYNDALWGGCLELDCGYGIRVKYCGITTELDAGDTVKVNQAVGTLGEVPCEAATEPHLHVEVTVDGDPLDVLKAIDRMNN
ncbi:MAG: M23 family metallopeptidase [Clostridia bacterium]|nr:M23 family metallopeptidase [Clostridia bacterium]